jgi:hypothetical protein
LIFRNFERVQARHARERHENHDTTGSAAAPFGSQHRHWLLRRSTAHTLGMDGERPNGTEPNQTFALLADLGALIEASPAGIIGNMPCFPSPR